MKAKKIVFLFLGVLADFLAHYLISNRLLVTKNYGMSLSINWINPLFLNIFFVLIIGWFYFKKESYFLVLILIGGLVNMIDRLIFGFVKDYWSFSGMVVNNLNDWLIGFGVLLFSVEGLWKK